MKQSIQLMTRFKEASQGYFHDYNKARKAFGGKLWTAPNTLIREDVITLLYGAGMES